MNTESKPEIKRCTRCVMPSTWPGIVFDENGVCNLCHSHDEKMKIDWNDRHVRLLEVLDWGGEYANAHGVKYDCLVGYSGGKDTAYTLWAVVKKYHMTPLVVNFDHGFKLGPEAEYNIKEIPKMLNCDYLRFSIGNDLRNKLCKKGCELIGDFCIHCHLGVGAFPARVSKMFNIPLQVWGEPTAEYQTTGTGYSFADLEEQNEEHYKKAFQAGVTPDKLFPMRRGDGYAYTTHYHDDDLQPLTWPKLGDFPLKAIYLGNYEPWDQYEHARIIKEELGWKDYPKQETWQSWDKNDCRQELVREVQKQYRRGFGKASFAASKEIREGRITREKGLALVEKYENKNLYGLDELCREMGFEGLAELLNMTNKTI